MSGIMKPKWLIAAICDDATPKAQIEFELAKDINDIRNDPTIKDKPPEPDLNFEWIDIEDIKPRHRGRQHGLDSKGEITVISHMRERYRQLMPRPVMALLLNRDLMYAHELKGMFESILKDPFFNLDADIDRQLKPSMGSSGYIPNLDVDRRFVYCFGSTTDVYITMRCRDKSNNKCSIFARTGCAGCRKNVAECCHTCYWYLVGMIVGAHHLPKPNPNTPETMARIKNILPYANAPYIYGMCPEK